MTEAKAYILIDANGDYVVDGDVDNLDANFNENVGVPTHPTRVLSITLQVPEPSAIELTADVPADEVAEIAMKVA